MTQPNKTPTNKTGQSLPHNNTINHLPYNLTNRISYTIILLLDVLGACIQMVWLSDGGPIRFLNIVCTKANQMKTIHFGSVYERQIQNYRHYNFFIPDILVQFSNGKDRMAAILYLPVDYKTIEIPERSAIQY